MIRPTAFETKVPYSTKLWWSKTLADPPIQTFWQKKILADGDNKLLVVHTELIIMWLLDDD